MSSGFRKERNIGESRSTEQRPRRRPRKERNIEESRSTVWRPGGSLPLVPVRAKAAARGVECAEPGRDAAAADEVEHGKHGDGEEHPECPDEELAAADEAADVDVLLSCGNASTSACCATCCTCAPPWSACPMAACATSSLRCCAWSAWRTARRNSLERPRHAYAGRSTRSGGFAWRQGDEGYKMRTSCADFHRFVQQSVAAKH